jgi:hypothetical protein
LLQAARGDIELESVDVKIVESGLKVRRLGGHGHEIQPRGLHLDGRGDECAAGALMKLRIVFLAVATLAAGCLSAPAKPAADGSVICTYPEPGGTSLCQVATNLTAKQVTSQTALCASSQGTIVQACPGGAVGCCTTVSGAVDFNQCYYGITVAMGESTCETMMGAWTPGPETSDADANDAGANDAGANDAGANDAGANDAGANDAGANDAGANDAGAND